MPLDQKFAQAADRKSEDAKKSKDQNDPLISTTARRIADEFKVSEPTIKRDAKFAEAVDLIAMVSPA